MAAQMGDEMMAAKAGVVKAPPKDDNDFQQRVAGWTQFLQTPEIQAALVQFGVNALQPVAPGQTQLGHAAAAMGAGVGAAGRVQQLEYEKQQQMTENQRKERMLKNDETRTGIAADGLTVQREGLQVERDQLGAQVADNAANRGLKEQEIAIQKAKADADANYQNKSLGNQALGLQNDAAQLAVQKTNADSNAAANQAQIDSAKLGGPEGVRIKARANALKAEAMATGQNMTDEQAYLMAEAQIAQMNASPVQMGSTIVGLYGQAAAIGKEIPLMPEGPEKEAAKARQQAIYNQAEGLSRSMFGDGASGAVPPGTEPPPVAGASTTATPTGGVPGPVTKNSRGEKGHYLLDANGKKMTDKQGRPYFKKVQ